MKRIWKRVRYRIEWLALAVALKLVPLLSRNACYQLGGVLGSLAATLDGHGRRVALANLEAAFGDKFSAAERERIARESYQHFARTMLDLFWSPRLTSENFREYIEFANLEEIRAEAVPGRPVIVAGFHYSNWEWLSLGFGWLGLSAAIATEEFKNPLFGEFFAKLREQSGQVTVPRRGAIVKLYKTLRRNGRVALLVDTTLPPHHPTVVIECFGLKTIVTVAHAWLEERTHGQVDRLHLQLSPMVLRAIVEEFVGRLTGKQTMYQMIALAEEIEKRGGTPLDPLEYKNQYLALLNDQIRDTISELREDRSQRVDRRRDHDQVRHRHHAEVGVRGGDDLAFQRFARGERVGVAAHDHRVRSGFFQRERERRSHQSESHDRDR